MIFEEYIKTGKVIKGERDLQKARSLIITSDNSFKTAELIEINNITSSTIFTILYESLRELLEAMCLREGYKIYSHEALTAYLIKLNEERLAEDFDRYRKLRNGINYYGKQVSENTIKETKEKIKEISNILKNKYLK